MGAGTSIPDRVLRQVCGATPIQRRNGFWQQFMHLLHADRVFFCTSRQCREFVLGKSAGFCEQLVNNNAQTRHFQIFLELVISSVRDAAFPHMHALEPFEEVREFLCAINGLFLVRHYLHYLLSPGGRGQTDPAQALKDNFFVQKPRRSCRKNTSASRRQTRVPVLETCNLPSAAPTGQRNQRTGISEPVGSRAKAAISCPKPSLLPNSTQMKQVAGSAVTTPEKSNDKLGVVQDRDSRRKSDETLDTVAKEDAFASSILFDLVEVLIKVASGKFGVVSSHSSSAAGGSSGPGNRRCVLTHEHFLLRFEAVNCLIALLALSWITSDPPTASSASDRKAIAAAPAPQVELWHLLFRASTQSRAGGAAWAPALIAALLEDVTASTPPGRELCSARQQEQKRVPTSSIDALNELCNSWRGSQAAAWSASSRARPNEKALGTSIGGGNEGVGNHGAVAQSRVTSLLMSPFSPLSTAAHSVLNYSANVWTRAKRRLSTTAANISIAAGDVDTRAGQDPHLETLSALVSPGRNLALLLLLLHTYYNDQSRDGVAGGEGATKAGSAVPCNHDLQKTSGDRAQNPFDDAFRKLRDIDDDYDSDVDDEDDDQHKATSKRPSFSRDSSSPIRMVRGASSVSFRLLYEALPNLFQNLTAGLRERDAFNAASGGAFAADAPTGGLKPADAAGGLVAALFAYALLHNCHRFREFFLSRSDVETVLLPLLQSICAVARWFQGLQEWKAQSSFSFGDENARQGPPSEAHTVEQLMTETLQLLLITVMRMSEDASLNDVIHCNLEVADVDWHRIAKGGAKAVLKKISLGSLVFFVVVQTLAANINCIKDANVHSYCLGVLYNTTPHAHDLHSVCCQRLLALISGLRQRYMQYAQQAREMQLEASEWTNSSTSFENSAITQFTEYYGDLLSELLNVLSIAMRGGSSGLSGNVTLVYELLYSRAALRGLEADVRFRAIVAPIYTTVQLLARGLGLRYNAATLAGVPMEDPRIPRFTFSRGDVTKSGATQAALADLMRNWRGQQTWPSVVVDCVATGPFGMRRSAKSKESTASTAPATQPESSSKYVYEETSRPATFFGPMIRRAAAALCPDVFPHIVPCTLEGGTDRSVLLRQTSALAVAESSHSDRLEVTPKGQAPNRAALNIDSIRDREACPLCVTGTTDDSPRASF